MFNQPTTCKNYKTLTSRPSHDKNNLDPEISSNVTKAFYKHALSLRKVFGIQQNPINNLENTINTNTQEGYPSGKICYKNNNLPLLKSKLEYRRNEAYSPYFLNKIESSKSSPVFLHSGLCDTVKSSKRLIGAYSTKAKFSKEQTESIKNQCLPSIRKNKINLVNSDEVDLLTGW